MRMSRPVFGAIILLLTGTLLAPGAEAAARFARSSGNWNAITWGTSCTAGNVADPVAADTVTICDGVTVTVNVSPTVTSITMPTGPTNTILQITSAQTLTTGSVTMTAGSGTGDHRQFLLSNNAELVVSGNFTLNGAGNDDRYALLQISGAEVTIGGNLVIDGLVAGNDRARVTLANTSTLTVGGSITLDTGGLLNNGNTTNSVINLGGSFDHVNANNDYVSTGGVFRLTGSVGQTLSGAATTTFHQLVVNKPSNDVTLTHNIIVAGNTATSMLVLTQGRVITGANYVAVGAAGATATTISGAGTASYVIGNLRRYIPTGTQSGIEFPVGGSTALKYAPVEIDFPNIGTAGYFQVAASTANTDHPNIATSGLDSAASVNRYWTLTNAGLAYGTTANVTFNYPASDVDGGADTSAFLAGDYSSPNWVYPTMGTLTATSSQATGLTSAAIVGEFAIGEMLPPYSYWRMNEASWNGTANEVADFGSSSNPATAASMGTTAKPTTSNTSPAIAGTPGTCRYGVFNRSIKNYLSLSTGYPNLMATGQTGFSVTAWVRSTNSTLPGQRILIDDQNDTSPGSWGFSVGETDRNGAGGVRFYYRQATTITIDTDPVPSNVWLFVALSVSLATGTNASVGTIYVYNANGTLNTTYSSNFTWTAGSDAGPPSIGGETNASGEGTDQFGFSGNIDELRVYRAPLSQTLVNRVRQLTNPCEVTDHYAISGNATAVTCDVTSVQITAHNAAHTPVSPSAGVSLNLTTSTGTGVWQAGTAFGTGAWSPSGINNGAATYTWPGGESTFTVRLRHNVAANVNINLSDSNTKTESATEDLAIVFADSAFRVTDATGTAAVSIGTQLSAKNSNTGFGAETLYLQAIRTDTNTGSCVGIFQNQTVTVEMAAARINPTAIPPSGIGNGQVSVMNNSSAMVALGTGAGIAGTYAGVSLAFDAASKAPLIVNYPNAGSVRLFARYLLPAPPANTYVTGTSNTFVVRPFGFRISGPPSGRIGPGSTFYARAGETWPQAITVTAVAWAAGEDVSPIDGIPDTDAFLTGNAITDNYGDEAAPFTPTATVTHTLAEPSGGNNGTLSAPLSAFADGVATATASWSEVGLINLFAVSSAYLGTAQVVRNSLPGYTGVGRFRPYDLAVARNTPAFTIACAAGNFTYVGQTFNYLTVPVITVRGRNQAGVTTQNYSGTFWKVTSGSLSAKAYAALSGTLSTAGITGTDPVIGYNGDGITVPQPAAGTGTLTFTSGTGLSFTRSTPVAPFDAEISLAITIADTESVAVANIDGVAATNPVRFGTATAGNGIAFGAPAVAAAKQMRFGRLRLQSANGSERLPLAVRVEAQYWNGSGFIINGSDSCTPLVAGNVALGNYQGNLASGETTVTVTGAITNGVGALRLSAPGAANNGSVDLSINLGSTSTGASCIAGMAASTAGNRAWLQGAWCGTAYDDDPSARATFGKYKGADPFIYLRENY